MRDAAATQSVMAGHGLYSAHSQPQHAAGAVGYPYLEQAAAEVPMPGASTPVVIGDFGCAGGRNEMDPIAIAVDGLRERGIGSPVEVFHTDLPENDFGPLFELLEGSAGYPHGRSEVYPAVIGRTLYGPLLPAQTLTLGWSGITLHWLSSMPCVVPDQVFSNLTTGIAREQLQERSRQDWHTFLVERARELVDDGQLVLVVGASGSDGRSGAEGLFSMINEQLAAMVVAHTLRRSEYERIFYPTWNRTPEEFLAPFHASPIDELFEVLDHREDITDDATTFPQYQRDGDAEAFATAYTPFVRAITEVPFFRSLDDDRDHDTREQLIDAFYDGLRRRIAGDPSTAACRWHVVSLRLRRARR